MRRRTHACAGELAFDGAAAAVRVAALDGLALLAQNPLAQPLVRQLLPGLKPALWDASLAVRAALAGFLLTIGCALKGSLCCTECSLHCSCLLVFTKEGVFSHHVVRDQQK